MARSEFSQEQAFEVLKSTRRRYALYHLRREDEPVDLSDLTDQVAAWENDTTPARLTSEQRKRVYVSLYQTHLPKFDEAGLIDYEREIGEVHLSPRARELESYLGAPNPKIPWHHYYLALSLGSLLFVGGVWLEISLLSVLSGFVAVAVIVSMYGISALGQYLTNHRT